MEASPRYASYYRSRTTELFVPPSNTIRNEMSPYTNGDHFRNMKANVKEWTAVYYALVSEIDGMLGEVLMTLNATGLDGNTLVVFTSDHGEMLGAHGMAGKANFYEESVRVPLLMRFPGVIPAGHVIKTPVSHLDVLSTVLDYLNAKHLDRSDGRSLRPLVDGRRYNKHFDEGVAVAELDPRYPISASELSGTLGTEPNFMIRHGNYKLMIAKLASAKTRDMLIDLENDPFETNNLLAGTPRDWVIGKAEHLKLLLLQWMRQKNNGQRGLFSAPVWNRFQGRGDLVEITRRRQWSKLPYWQSDRLLGFGTPTLRPNGLYARKEYLYVGRTVPGQLSIRVAIVGPDRDLFEYGPKTAMMGSGGSRRIWVEYASETERTFDTVRATLLIMSNVKGVQRIPIVASPY